MTYARVNRNSDAQFWRGRGAMLHVSKTWAPAPVPGLPPLWSPGTTYNVGRRAEKARRREMREARREVHRSRFFDLHRPGERAYRDGLVNQLLGVSRG